MPPEIVIDMVPGRGGAVHAYYLTGECFAAPFRHEYTLASHDTVSGLGFSLVLFEFSLVLPPF